MLSPDRNAVAWPAQVSSTVSTRTCMHFIPAFLVRVPAGFQRLTKGTVLKGALICVCINPIKGLMYGVMHDGGAWAALAQAMAACGVSLTPGPSTHDDSKISVTLSQCDQAFLLLAALHGGYTASCGLAAERCGSSAPRKLA